MRANLLALAAMAAAAASAPFDITDLGGFAATEAGFLTLANIGAAAAPALIISQFTGNPFAQDMIGAVFNVGGLVSTNSIPNATVMELTSSIVWPNDVEPAGLSGSPSGVGSFAGLIAPGGFLVPPKSVGAVNFLSLNEQGQVTNTTKVSVDKGNALLDGFFYHRAVLHDVDRDGYVDVLAARASKPLIGSSSGELVWMRQPPGVANPLAPAVTPWAETVLVNGSFAPDVFFGLANLNNDGDEQLFYTSFFTGGGLGMLLCPGCAATTAAGLPVNSWANSASLQMVVLDTAMGPGFDVEVVDLNGDGRLDLLVTNHVDNASQPYTSAVFGFEAPAPPTPLTNASAWRKYVLAADFPVREWGPNQAAPGGARSLPVPWSSAAGYGSKPLITVAGDGDQRFYILAPNSADPADWTYTQVQAWDCGGTVGRQVAGDVDGDPSTIEVFVPCYDSGRIEVLQLSAPSAV